MSIDLTSYHALSESCSMSAMAEVTASGRRNPGKVAIPEISNIKMHRMKYPSYFLLCLKENELQNIIGGP